MCHFGMVVFGLGERFTAESAEKRLKRILATDAHGHTRTGKIKARELKAESLKEKNSPRRSRGRREKIKAERELATDRQRSSKLKGREAQSSKQRIHRRDAKGARLNELRSFSTKNLTQLNQGIIKEISAQSQNL